MRHLLTTAFLFAFIMGHLPVAMAEIYTYTDDRGVIHFTDTPNNPRFQALATRKKTTHNESKYDRMIRILCRKHQMDFSLVKAVVKAESAFNPRAVSQKGARGLMQLMPDTARELSVHDSFDPYDNLQGGVRYLRKMLDIFNDNITLAVAAYNAGPNAVQSANAVPPYPETRTYVQRVLQYRQEYLNRR